MSKQVVVVGGGVIGLLTAFNLAPKVDGGGMRSG